MENAGLRFSVECQPLAEPVYVDRDMWEKVVSNLLSNAFKFTFEGAVTVTLTPVDGAAELQVRDTGVGIPEDQRDARLRALSSDRGHAGPDVRRHGDRPGARSGTGQTARRPCAGGEHGRSRQHVHRDDSARHGAFAGGAHPGRAIDRVDGNREPTRMPRRRSGGCRTTGARPMPRCFPSSASRAPSPTPEPAATRERDRRGRRQRGHASIPQAPAGRPI